MMTMARMSYSLKHERRNLRLNVPARRQRALDANDIRADPTARTIAE
tara:strand:- start:1134 stop:1274 length:141 start_codon:yes stop_codon:yes gene_type:complete